MTRQQERRGAFASADKVRGSWLASTDLGAMIRVLLKRPGPYTPVAQESIWPLHLPGKRLLRLFAISCSMEGWSDADVVRGADWVREAYIQADGGIPSLTGEEPTWYAMNRDTGLMLEHIAARFPSESVRVGKVRMCELIRDICPDPWAPPHLADQYRTEDAVALAHGCYNDAPLWPGGRWRLDPVTLNVLADALEDAGVQHVEVVPCPRKCWELFGVRVVGPIRVSGETGDEVITSPQRCDCAGGMVTARSPHPIVPALRDDRPHYRGFWPVDLVLGKQ